MDKKGYSTGLTWVFGLVSLFGLGILFIVFDQVFRVHLNPIIITQINTSNADNATKEEAFSFITQWMSFWEALPVILFIVIIIYLIINAIRRNREQEQFY